VLSNARRPFIPLQNGNCQEEQGASRCKGFTGKSTANWGASLQRYVALKVQKSAQHYAEAAMDETNILKELQMVIWRTENVL